MFDTIVLGVDLNDTTGLDRLAKAVNALHALSIHVVNVVPDLGMPMVGMALQPDHSKSMLDEVKVKLTEWTDANVPGATPHVRQGSVYDCILKVADHVGADAIVVGAQRPELKDYLFGPNAARIARHASQSVLVVR